jgi:hypothetical protein
MARAIRLASRPHKDTISDIPAITDEQRREADM